MTDLDKLIEAVVAGTATMGNFARVFPSETAYGKTTWGTAHNAFSGSLDAAKWLHDALLPGTDARLEIRKKPKAWVSERLASTWGDASSAEIPARAWLLAILKAYRAQVQK